MCEQSSVNFNSGDVVWVKLGPCWWPGEVVPFEELPTYITESFKKSPLYAVKFFDEEKYEFVRQLTHISSYNSNKKYDYIKKGLDLYRAKHSFMEKFCGDVVTAEKKTDGDPNILSDSRLEPEKKPDYSSIFGSPLPKKAKDSPSRGRGRNSGGKSRSSLGSTRKISNLITHPRFLGNDDSEVRILVQTPRETKLPEPEYECYSCGFKCNRIEVIVFHNKSHLRGDTSSPQASSKKKKSPAKRSKKRRLPISKTTTIDEDLELLRQGLPVCSEDSSDEESSFSSSSTSSSSSSSTATLTSSSDEEPLIKRKAKGKTPAKAKKPKPPRPPPEIKKQTDICTDLLAEWDDDEDEDENQPVAQRLSPEVAQEAEKDPPKTEEKEKEKSCFDFEEDEEALLTTVEGRKIPRVIPPTDRRKSIQESEKIPTEDKSRSASPKLIEDNIIESETDKSKENKEPELENDDVERRRESQFQMEFEAFNNALKETSVPKLVDIPPVHKYEQNFHSTKTIKFPDKSEEEPSTAKESTPPPPDLEASIKIEEEVIESTQIESVVEALPSEPVKEPVVKNTEVATKLTNPKKRFVKTFEDETKNSSKESTVIEKEEAGIEPVTNELKPLEVSKLKTQLMKKLVDATSKKENTKQVEKSRRTPMHRGRRSRTFVEVKKIQPAENKDNKRSSAELISDNETNVNLKKKKNSSDYLDDSNKIPDTKVDIVELKDAQKQSTIKEAKPTKDIPDEQQSMENKLAAHLEYLNTSPSKIFSDLHVDKDDLLEASSLSESQRLTIQNIIGVTSPMMMMQPSINDKKIEKVQDEPTKVIKEKEDTTEEVTEKIELEPKEVDREKVQDQLIPTEIEIQKGIIETTDESVTIEDKSDPIETTDQIFKITEKLDQSISDKLPDDIIESPNVESDVKIIEEPIEIELVTEANKKLEEDVDKSIDDKKLNQAIDDIPEPSKNEEEVMVEDIKSSTKEELVKEEFVKEELVKEEKEMKVIKDKFKGNKEKGRGNKGKAKSSKEKIKEKTKEILREIKEKTRQRKERSERIIEADVKEEIKEDTPKIEIEEEKVKLKEESLQIETIEENITKDELIEKSKDESEDVPVIKEIDKVVEEPIKADMENENQQDDKILKESQETTKPDIEKDLQLPSEPITTHPANDLVKSIFQEDDIVNIEGNLTVVTESDLADKQVEIATTPEVSKPITLASFSMDFCEDVESYVKGETIIQKSSSPPTIERIEEKKSGKDDSQKQPVEIETIEKVDRNKDSPTPPEERLKELYSGESRGRKRKSDKFALDVQGIERTIGNEGVNKLKKFEDIIPAKEIPPPVIMEGFDDSLKDDVADDNLTIDESNLKEQIIPEKENVIVETIEKVPIEDSKDFYKEHITQDIVTEISQKEEIIIPPIDISVESEVAKITDSIAEQEVIIHDNHHSTSSTKLLEILTDKPKSNSTKPSAMLTTISHSDESRITTSKAPYKYSKLITKQSMAGPSRTSKATILSDKLIKPLDESKTVSVKKVTSKRSFQDVEDIDTYIIQKPAKKFNISMESESSSPPKVIKKTPVISKGKARILQQTIITPTGDILQPPVSQASADDNMFDINSMPIVLSDQILTPEGIENMQIVLQDTPITTTKSQINPIKKITQPQQQVKLLNKTQSPVGLKDNLLKTPIQKTSIASAISKHKTQKIYPTVTTTPNPAKILKHNPSVIAQPGKQGKIIIVPATTTATGSKYTVGKRPTIVKKPPQKIMTPISKIPDSPITSGGNKIMILKGQGQQQKILLTTPQKQIPPSKIKGRTIGQKQIITKDSPQQKGANIISQTIVNSKGQITTLASHGQIGNRQVMTAVAAQNRSIKIDPMKLKRTQQQRLGLVSELAKPSTSGQHRTIIIKNPQGQTVKKIHGTDDALLDQQVAEQLQAISRASASQQLKDLSARVSSKLPAKKPYFKKQEPIKQTITKTILHNTQVGAKSVSSVPPLAPISPTKKVDAHYTETIEEKTEEAKRPPHQLVIQDAQGNQTTITEGQILALPSEAIDGQPHAYVLVTLDETGNLTPLNSEALMSLDPNLNLTSDLGNMVLHIDQGSTPDTEASLPETAQQRPVTERVESGNSENLLLKETVEKTPVENVLLPDTPASESGDQNVQAVINSGEMGQLIITGDAATAQKFLESLAEGNADLANLLANAEGNVLIQADGQQILINTDSENPMLVMNPESISNENSEGSGNPIFAGQPVKNQDILAAALADTDVFQQDQSISHSPSKVVQSQLSPNSTLYPMNVTNVLETNSMNSPIMTPLEVPSTNSKKIDDENEILNQVPKNVDLPITITDPNISQTVAQQQVASLMASELQTNLDLPLAIQDPGLSVTSAEMNSPSFVYSLPTLDDTVDINQKAFSGSISMPLLTEEPEDPITDPSNNDSSNNDPSNAKEEKSVEDKKDPEEKVDKIGEEDGKKSDDKKTDFIDSDGLCAMRGGICNSLSEPPPDMFDFSVGNQYEPSQLTQVGEIDIPSSETTATLNDRENSVSSMEERKNEEVALYTVNTSPSTNTDDSCEIPIQPAIIAKPFEENGDSRLDDGEKLTPEVDV